MRWLLALCLFVLSNINAQADDTELPSIENPGAVFHSFALNWAINVHVDSLGKVRITGSGNEEINLSYVDVKLWEQVQRVTNRYGGENVEDVYDERRGICDGRTYRVAASTKTKSAFLLVGRECGGAFNKSDEAGREIRVIFENVLREKLDP